MKKPALVAAAALLLLLIFWAGFALNFPGEALSRVMAARLNRIPNIEVRLSPATLGMFSLRVDEFRLSLANPGQSLPMLVLKEVRIPFTWALFSGLPVAAGIGKEGRFALFIPWGEGEMTISGTSLRMEDIHGFKALAPASLRGGLSFSGKFRLAPQAQSRRAVKLPEGELTAKAEAVELANLGVMGAVLPVTRLESAELKLKTGKRIDVENFTLRGDVQGGIKGFIQPRLASIGNSPMRLRVTVSFKQTWLRKLGSMRPLVESFLNNGRLEAVVRGSLGKPEFKRERGT